MTTEPKFKVGDRVVVLHTGLLHSSQLPAVGRVFTVQKVQTRLPDNEHLYVLDDETAKYFGYLEPELRLTVSEDLIQEYQRDQSAEAAPGNESACR